MGCTQSKIENEEAVARCKERKHLMKDAVSARNAFAAAHSSYATYLKNTGAALSDFAHGEVQNPQFDPATIANSSVATQPSFEIPPPPPPLPNFPPAPLQRAASMPEIKMSKPQLEPVGTIIEEEEEENELENDGALNVRLRRRRSNRNSGGSSRGGTKEVEEEEEGARPPVPPPLSKSKPETQLETNHPMPPPLQDSALEYFFPSMENTPGTSLSAAEEVSINKEEVERKEFNEKPNIVGGGKDGVPEPVPMPENMAEPPPAPSEAMVVAQTGKSSKKVKQGQVSMMEGKKIVKQNVNLQQIFNELDDHFLKASESAHEVSKMLEATRMHYHSNFADNRGNVLDFFDSE